MSILQELYDSEINFVLSTLWDAGFDWRLGDELNGFKAEGCGLTLDEAIGQLAFAAFKNYPDSVFTKTHRARGRARTGGDLEARP